MWVFDAKTPYDLVNKTYSNCLGSEDIKIKCPTLVLDAEQDVYT